MTIFTSDVNLVRWQFSTTTNVNKGSFFNTVLHKNVILFSKIDYTLTVKYNTKKIEKDPLFYDFTMTCLPISDETCNFLGDHKLCIFTILGKNL